MKPLLAHIYEPHRVTYPCYCQPKLNGVRALYQGGFFQSRDEIPWKPAVLAHLSEPLKKVFGPDVILDGELYVHGWPLQRINAAVTPVRNEPTEDTLKVEYHIFDIANFELPFKERNFIRRQANSHNEQRQFYSVRTVHCGTEELANLLYAEFVTDGYEGMMYRLGDCPYTYPKQPWPKDYKTKEVAAKNWAGPAHLNYRTKTRAMSDKDNRCWHLLKRKDWHDDEFLITGVMMGEGKLNGTLGSLTCVTPSGKTFSVGSGLTDTERHHYWKNSPVGQKVKVKYLVRSSDGIPLNPTILCINPK